MEKKNASDVFVECLEASGIDVIFGLPGDGINGVIEALRKKRDKVRFIQVRHEEAAALAAVGYAKFTGRLGVCLSTTGPGAVHLLNGLYDAKLDQMPVLAITGLPYHDLIGTHYQQDVATDRLFADVSVFSERIMGPLHVESMVHQAVRTALARRGVAHLAFPNDFQDQPLEQDQRSQMNEAGHSGHRWQPARVVPPDTELERAADVLNAGRKVAIVVGSGARGAREEVLQIAELLGAPIGKALLGKDVIPDDSPFTTGTMGVLGTAASAQMMNEADTLFMIGTSFPYISYLPKPGQARGVQIDINPERVSLRYPVEVGLVGDAAPTLRQLLPRLKRNPERAFLESTQAKMKEWRALMQHRGTSHDLPIRPQTVAWEVNRVLRDDAILCVDSGQNTVFAARHFQIRGQQRFSCSGLLATMGCALPYAIGAQIAYPDRQVVVFTGDGGLTMVLGELATCAKYNLPVKVVVLKNNVLGMIRWEQMMFLGNPEYAVELENVEFAPLARAFGWTSFHVDRPENLAPTLSAALQHPGPALVEAAVDPFEPLMPGQIKPQQAENYAEALRRGEPNRQRIGLTLFRDAIEDLETNRKTLLEPLQEQVPGLLPTDDKP